MDLSQEFQKHVGKIVKDPDRMTCDCDSVVDAIQSEAAGHGLKFRFLKVDKAEKIDAAASPTVYCAITKEGIPQDKPWGWRIKEINCF